MDACSDADEKVVAPYLCQSDRHIEDIITGGDRCIMSAVNVQETATVPRPRHGAAAYERFWDMGAGPDTKRWAQMVCFPP